MHELSEPGFMAANSRWLNAVLFQLGWFSCVLGGDLIAVVVTATIMFAHSQLFMRGNREYLLILGVTCIGIAIDSFWAYTGVLAFSETATFIPLWLLCIWMLFATSLCHSLQWLHQHLLFAAVLGAVAGPTSYLGGAALAGVVIGEPRVLSIAVIALAWSLLMPLLMLIASELGDRRGQG